MVIYKHNVEFFFSNAGCTSFKRAVFNDSKENLLPDSTFLFKLD